jgi:microcystin-dependent protein
MTILQARRAVVRAPLIGAVVAYAGSAAPTGWLFCFGQNVSRTTYAQLFGVIGTTYGIGDGSTTFGLPDLRGRVPFGLDNMGGSAASRLTGAQTGGLNANALGNSGGEQGHTQTTAEMASHNHAPSDGGTFRSNQSAGGATSGGTALALGSAMSSTGGGGAHNNVPPALNYMIFAGQ